MHHLLWAPSFAGGAALAAAGGTSGETIAAIMGGIAAVISAVAGLVVALHGRDSQVIVVSPEEAEELGLAHLSTVKARRKARR